jgi:hypothetical protein
MPAQALLERIMNKQKTGKRNLILRGLLNWVQMIME